MTIRSWIYSGMVVMSFLLIACGNQSESKKQQPESTPVVSKSVPSTRPDTATLLPIMIWLEEDMNTLSAGLWRENYELIAEAAAAISDHPKISKKQIGTIRTILGEKEFKAFVKDDRTVHNTAHDIARAADNKNFKTVTGKYIELNRGCISCHVKHRGKIRDSPQW